MSIDPKKIWEDAQSTERERRSNTDDVQSERRAFAEKTFQPINVALKELIPELEKIRNARVLLYENQALFKWIESNKNLGEIKIAGSGIRTSAYPDGGYTVSINSADIAMFYPGKSQKQFHPNEAEAALKYFLSEISKLK